MSQTATLEAGTDHYQLEDGSGNYLWNLGVTQGGSGTTIYIYDNQYSANGTNFTFAEISSEFPADFIDTGATPKAYRASVDLQIGDTETGSATTTLTDTNVSVFWDTSKKLKWRNTQTTSWFLNLGTKVINSSGRGSGINGCKLYQGAACTFRGAWNFYDCELLTQGGQLGFIVDNVGFTDVAGCTIGNAGTSSTSTIALGIGAQGIPVIDNVNFWGKLSSGSLGYLSTFNASDVSNCTFSLPNSTTGAHIRSSSSRLNLTSPIFLGTPVLADIICNNDTAGLDTPVAWTIQRPVWSGNATKIYFGSNVVDPGYVIEAWGYNLKVVDRDGNPIANIPVTLTDGVGDPNNSFSTTTDSYGAVTFYLLSAGGTLSIQGMIVVDHYSDGVSSLTRHRSPFTLLVNSASQAGYNSNYLTRKRVFYWPGYETGIFSDVFDIVQLLEPGSGVPTSWTECSLS